MRRTLALTLFILFSLSISAQEVYVTEGLVVNNTNTGNWEGVNIPRNVPLKLYFRNNSITSVNTAGYMLQAGDEAPMLSNNRLDNAVISGNKFTWKGNISPSIITHGLFYGYNVNGQIQYNYLDNVPYGIIFKSGNDAGQNMTYTSGGAFYNIVKNGHFAVRMKGINGVRIYNNTFYSGDQAGWHLILITGNMDMARSSPSTGAKVYNNIFYTKYKIPSIQIDSRATLQDFECDYNVYYCEDGDHTPIFSVGNVEYSWNDWRAMGFDAHSVVKNPDFINTVTFVPRQRLDHGLDLGSTLQSGLSTSASWNPGVAPALTAQNGKWQVGAIVHPPASTPPPVTPPPVTPPPVTPPPVTPPPVTPPPVTPPPPENTPPVIRIKAPTEGYSGFVGEIDASSSSDADKDKLTFTWVVPPGVSVSSTSNPKIKFLAPIVSAAQVIDFSLKLSDGKTTRTQTTSIRIIPYMPELEKAEIADIRASNFQAPNYPSAAIDGDIGTMWSANGDNQWLLLELTEPFNVQHVKIAFQPGQKKVSYFDLMGSEDGQTWEPILTKSASCGFSGDLHVFDFPPAKMSVPCKFIKYVGHSNSLDSWNFISEFRIFGYKYQIPGKKKDPLVILYPNPARDIINISIEDSGLKPELIRILNPTGTIVYEKKINPEERDIQVPVSFRCGLYIVQMSSGDLTLFTQKIIVNC